MSYCIAVLVITFCGHQDIAEFLNIYDARIKTR